MSESWMTMNTLEEFVEQISGNIAASYRARTIVWSGLPDSTPWKKEQYERIREIPAESED